MNSVKQAAPNSYTDPFWSDLSGRVEAKLDLPAGLLTSVITKGERSNHDQVSEAGARTVAQITPSTRKAAIDKYGIDPYFSPQNAIEVAGLLLKDSLKRNDNDPAIAVAEYHGGTDRANWGPKTKAYVSRVIADSSKAPLPAPLPLPDTPAMPDPSQPMRPGTSTFDRLAASMGKPAESAIAKIYQAYQSGQMPPEDAQQFEVDVNAGHIMLPRGATLRGSASMAPQTNASLNPGSAIMLPDAVAQAYATGRMSVEDRIQLEQDIRAGVVKMPDGVEIHDTKAPGFLARLAESVTGTERRTPETDAAPDWASMPELNSFSLASAKTGLGTLLSNPQETVQIIQANFPGVKVTQDPKGNYLLQSSIDGKQYAIKPGFQVSDIPRVAGAVAAFTPAGRATSVVGSGLASAATQAAIEGTQAATGGDFNAGDVLTSGLLGAAVPAVVNTAKAAARPAANLLDRVRGVAPAVDDGSAVRSSAMGDAVQAAVQPSRPVGAAQGVPGSSQATHSVNPAASSDVGRSAGAAISSADSGVGLARANMSATDLAQTAKKAAGGGLGSKSATETLAGQAAPNAKTLDAAKRLGIEDYLQPDHVTTNQAYRELAQAVKSVPGSEARATEMQGLEQVAQRADKLINDIGGTADLSSLDASVKRSLQATQNELEARANKLYADLRKSIPATTEAPADNVLSFVEQRAKELGGKQNLTPMEKQILARLSPKAGGGRPELAPSIESGDFTTPSQLRQAREASGQRGVMFGQGPQPPKPGIVPTLRQPTYALLDDVRKDLGAAARQAGPFKDADTGLAKKLYSLLSDDQAAIVGRHGMAETYNAARQAIAVRKGIEDDLVALFGKQLDRSIVGDLSGAIQALPKGDTSKLVKLLKSVPTEMRQEVTASGLASAFRTAGTRGPISFSQYEKWYEGLLRNKQAHTTLMANLPPAARKQLSDLYRVSKGISAASRERITTGRIMAVREQFKAADGLAGKLYDVAKRSAVGATVGGAASTVVGPGAGAAIASALTKGAKPAADKAIDALIASPEFLAATRAAGTPKQAAAIKHLAASKEFTQFVRALNQPRELSNRERWILDAMQAEHALHEQ